MGGGASKSKTQKNLLKNQALEQAQAQAAAAAPPDAAEPEAEADATWQEMDFGKPPYGGLALADFAGEDQNELSFEDGDQLLILKDYENGWLLACLASRAGKLGDIPKSYIKRKELPPVIASADYVPADADRRFISVKKGEQLAKVTAFDDPGGSDDKWLLFVRPAREGDHYSKIGYCPGSVTTAVPEVEVIAAYDAAGKAGHVSVYATQMVWVFAGAGDTAEVLCHDGARGLVPRSVLPADPEVAPGPPKVTKAASFAKDDLKETTKKAEAGRRKSVVAMEAAAEATEKVAEVKRQSTAQGGADSAKMAAAIKEAEAIAAAAQKKAAEIEAAAAAALSAAREAEARAEKAVERAEAREKEAAKGYEGMKEEMDKLTAERDEATAAIQDSALQLRAAEMRAKQIEGQWMAEAMKRKELHNQLQDMVGSLRVACRVRPFKDAGTPTSIEIKKPAGDDPKVVVRQEDAPGGKPLVKEFPFTHVYGPESTQEQVFEDSEPLMTSVLDGFNVCIFAYGQSGSGKTHTMDGSAEQPGLAPRAMVRLFEAGKEREATYKHEFFISMLEIYNENIRDLLGDPKKQAELKLDVTKDEVLGMTCRGATSTPVSSADEAKVAVTAGNKNRSVGATNLNEQSSRSHMVVCLTVFSTQLLSGAQSVGKLSLVDLAGSEKLDKAGTTGTAVAETKAINKSLSALGSVIASLAANDKHVPYRDSKLTHLLADSLGGNSKTLMLAAVRGEVANAGETISSLTFAARAKTVKLGKAQARSAPKAPPKAAPKAPPKK